MWFIVKDGATSERFGSECLAFLQPVLYCKQGHWSQKFKEVLLQVDNYHNKQIFNKLAKIERS